MRQRAAWGGTEPMPPAIPVLLLMFAVVLVAGAWYLRQHHTTSRGADWVFQRSATWQTQVSWLPPVVLLVFRLAAFGVALWQLGRLLLPNGGAGFFAYNAYTVWNYTLLTLYFAIASVHSLCGVLRDDKAGGQAAVGDVNDREAALMPGGGAALAAWHHKLQLVLFEIELPAALLVTLIFWTVLAPGAVASARCDWCPDAVDNSTLGTSSSSALSCGKCVSNCSAAHHSSVHASGSASAQCGAHQVRLAQDGVVNTGNLMMHAANSLFMVLEMVLNKLPMHKAHFVFVGWWALAYAFFNIFIYQPITHDLVYPFMNPVEPPLELGLVMWMLGLLIGHWFFYFVARAVVMTKTLGCVAYCGRCESLPSPVNPSSLLVQA